MADDQIQNIVRYKLGKKGKFRKLYHEHKDEKSNKMCVFRHKSEKDSVTNPTKYDNYAIFLTLMSKYTHFVALFIFVLMIQ